MILSDRPRGFSTQRVLRFIANNSGYLLLAPAVMIFGTLVHELSHAAAAVLQGGEIRELKLLPSMDKGYFTFGYVDYRVGPGAHRDLITFAPSLVSSVIALLTTIVVPLLDRPGFAPRLAMIFVFMLPLVDISLACSALFLGSQHSDFYRLFAGHEIEVLCVFGAVMVFFLAIGWRVFLRSWGHQSLSGWEYGGGFLFVIAAPWFVRWM